MTQRRSAKSARIKRSAPHEGLRARYEAPESVSGRIPGRRKARGRSPEGCVACRRPSAAAGAGRDSSHKRGPGGACRCWRALASAPVADARSRRDVRWVARGVAALPQQPPAPGPTDPPSVGIHGVAGGVLAAPTPPAAVRLRHVAAQPQLGQRDHRLVAVVPLVRDHLGNASTGRQHSFDLLRRRDQRLDHRRRVAGAASCTVMPTTAPVSRSTACSALWARCVRPSFIFAIFASGSFGCFQSSLEPFFRRFRSKRASSARVGVGMPEAAARPRRNAS